jgi:predicted DNA-binding protein with PD1-like motif
VKSQSTEKIRHIVIFAEKGELLPDALIDELRDQAVTCGWLRGSGVVTDCEIRVYDAETGGLAPSRRLNGVSNLLMIDGSVGMTAGDVSLGLRVVIARETDRGMETIAGELTSAQAVAMEIFVTAIDDLAIARILDARAGVWLLGDESNAASASEVARKEAPKDKPRSSAWNEAIDASADAPRAAARPKSATASSAPMPARPAARPAAESDEGPMPEAGDLVEHFAFGSCEVVKSDGERIHLRVGKDGRIREIALEMLRVSPLPPADDAPNKRIWKLERRI